MKLTRSSNTDLPLYLKVRMYVEKIVSKKIDTIVSKSVINYVVSCSKVLICFPHVVVLVSNTICRKKLYEDERS